MPSGSTILHLKEKIHETLSIPCLLQVLVHGSTPATDFDEVYGALYQLLLSFQHMLHIVEQGTRAERLDVLLKLEEAASTCNPYSLKGNQQAIEIVVALLGGEGGGWGLASTCDHILRPETDHEHL